MSGSKSIDHIAEEVIDIAQRNLENVYTSLHTIALLYPSLSSSSSNGNGGNGTMLPYVTLSEFETFATDMRQVSSAETIAYVPMMQTVDDVKVWNTYSSKNQDWLLSSSSSSNTNSQPSMTPFIWKHDSVNGILADTSSSLFAPLWQMSPPKPEAVNFNLAASENDLYPVIASTLNSGSASLSKAFVESDNTVYPSVDSSSGTSSPTSVMMHPIISESLSIAGFITATVPWTSLFKNILHVGESGVVVVVESCGVNHTYGLDGPDAMHLGKGDLLQEANYKGSSTTADLMTNGCHHQMHVYTNLNETNNHDKMSQEIEVAVFCTLSVLFGCFLAFGYNFLKSRRNKGKDAKNTRDDEDKNSHGEESTAEDHEMANPPERQQQQQQTVRSVQEPFHQEPSEQQQQNTTPPPPHGSPKAPQRTPVVAPPESPKKPPPAPPLTEQSSAQRKNEAPPTPKKITMGDAASTKDALMSFVNETNTTAQSNSKPIAELFPEATVLFADIAGFTAWSSIREPSQVFTLLETIFQAYDVIAQRCGVFKVETVGDCYVAVVGVTEYKKDHALIMAHFARAAMDRFNTVVRDLELQLGPDTGELAMRFGIHSGPVTAGVLRGDRARFQLFGDTVNTAARIETNGMRGKIHLSEQTAAQIQSFGHHDWVVPRDDEIQAKGKGLLKTYWLRLNGELTKFKADQLAAERKAENANAGSDDEDEKIYKKPSFMEQVLARKAAKESQENKDRKKQRLIEWNTELLLQLLKQIVQKRRATYGEQDCPQEQLDSIDELWQSIGQGKMVVEEVQEIIHMPDFDKKTCSKTAKNVDIGKETIKELRNFVSLVASMYHENPFHNFEHASHVTMSVSKLMSRIIAPQNLKLACNEEEKDAALHDHTYGITSDPLTQFGVVLSALIHDVDHRGVPNFLLINENASLAAKYRKKSVAEQNSVDIAWASLLSPDFVNLRRCIATSKKSLKRFRELIVNSVIATDIFDKDLSAARKERWNKAFSDEGGDCSAKDAMDRKATIVIEHLIQASDVAHTMQHWHVYQKWNMKLYQEMYTAYVTGRWDKDPTPNWYNGEIGFFDNYVIPLAKKLQTCGVFGISSDEYLNYATQNRKEWGSRGQEDIDKMLENIRKQVEEEHGKPVEKDGL